MSAGDLTGALRREGAHRRSSRAQHETAPAGDDAAGPAPDPRQQLEAIREATRFELGLLHDRVNALLTAQTFLTIAFTATMAAEGTWAAVVAPTLSTLGLLLAVLAWPAVNATARLVITWTSLSGDLLDQHPEAHPVWLDAHADRRRRETDQRKSLLFFRAAPPLFTVVWVVLSGTVLLRG